MTSDGVLYVGTAKEYLKKSARSAKSVAEHNPGLGLAVVTSPTLAHDMEIDVFDHIITVKNPFDDVRDKCYNLHKTPFDRTLYLDADTYIMDEISSMYKILNKVDIAVWMGYKLTEINGVPDCFKEPNGGVMLYKANNRVNEFLSEWRKLYERQVQGDLDYENINKKNVNSIEDASSFGKYHDQPPLRKALYESDITYHVLPPEYNFKGQGRSAEDIVKILHFGNMDEDKQQRLISVINNDPLKPRVVWKNKLLVRDSSNYRLVSRRRQLINKGMQYVVLTPVPQILEYIGMKNKVGDYVNELKRRIS